jgi:uncharacterized protein (TIGR02284 family)
MLNHLIEMCKSEELVLRYAAEHVEDRSVKDLFADLAARRAQFVAELLPHLQRLGGGALVDVPTRTVFRRRWAGIKDALVGYNDHRMIVDAEHNDAATLAAYEDALDTMLPPTARDLIEEQRAEIRVAHTAMEKLLH